VSYGGSTYVSLTDGNHGNTPDQSPAQWAVLAAQGTAGPIGPAGVAGPTGVAGAAGPAGAIGPQGPPVQFTGAWGVARSYAVGDAAAYAGSSYIALTANVGREPDLNPAYWGILAAQGATGAQFRGAWGVGVAYAVSDAVSFGGSTYLAVAANTAEEPDLFPGGVGGDGG
jgi:hypothetical protein